MGENKLFNPTCILCGSCCYKLKYKVELYNFYRCLDCGLVYVYPTPSNEELKRIYQEESFYSEGFKRGTGKEIYRRMNVIQKFYNNNRGNLLDIGCAAGFFLSVARDKGWDTLGIEISERTAEYASKILNLNIINKPLEEIELPEESFDVITLWGVIEHVEDPLAFMNRVAKLLKKGGVIGMATNNVDGWMGRLMNDKFPFITYPEHLWLFNIKTIGKLIQKTGLRVIRVDTNDMITPEKAIRGINKILCDNIKFDNHPGIEAMFKVTTTLAQPMLLLCGRFNLGSEIEIYARKPINHYNK